MSNQLTITGYSTAMYSTWYFVKEMGALFDCGDGVTSGLVARAAGIKHVFLTHADRDHIGGLLQYLQLNARPALRIYFPRDCGSLKHLAEFCQNFDPHVESAQWLGIESGTEIRIRRDLAVRAIENRHIDSGKRQCKSLSYVVERIAQVLRPELAGKPGPEIAELKNRLGEDAVSQQSRKTVLIYSGDTPIETDGRYAKTETLIHEATFLSTRELTPDNPKRIKHSSLDQVLDMVSESDIQRLILGHFSTRYSNGQIVETLKREIRQRQLTVPVYAILPGQTVSDILSTKPVQESLPS